uniref:Uncharacterized protein n=1 Tax=Fagus sylvatica TaxID=28930 RepID=A0A2N9GFB6_FAGSY
MRGGRVGFIENRARLAQHHHARRMTVLRELWYCHVAVLSFHASSPSNPPRFPCAYPFLSDFRGQFWRSSGTQNGSCGISSESSRRPLSNDIKFARIGVRTRELWLPEVGVSELFLCTFPDEDSGQTGDAIGEPRVPRRSRSHYLSNAPGLADQLVASRKDSAREGGCSGFAGIRAWTREIWPPRAESTGVFLVRLRAVFRSGFRLDPDKFLAIREFHVVHGCVLLSNVPGLADQLVASQEDSVRKRGNVGGNEFGGKIPEICQPVFLFRRPVFTRVVDVAPDRRSWIRTILRIVGIPTILVSSESLRYLLFNVLATTLSFLVRFRPVKYGIEALDILYTIGQGVVSSIQFLVWSTVRSNLGQTWSTLVKLGRIWSKLSKLLEMYPGLHFKGFWARWVLVGLETARSNLGQTLVNPSQTWSTLVKLGQTLGNVSRTFFLGVFDVASPRRIRTGLVRAVLVLRADTRENPGGKNGVMTT